MAQRFKYVFGVKYKLMIREDNVAIVSGSNSLMLGLLFLFG